MTLILTFRQIELSDREWIRPLIVASETRNSDFSFNNMFAWRHEYSQLIHKGDGFVLGRFNLDGESFVSFPIGVRDDRQLLEILQELRSTLAPLSLAGLSAEHVAALERIAPGEFTVTAPESLADYLYDIDRLASLSGKKLHAKRNHINRFEQEFPNRVFEPLTSENLGECLVTDGLWAYEKSDEQFDTIPGEIRALEQATTHFTALELDGGLVRLTPGGTVIAFTIGERLSRDTYVTHFEKALPDFVGAYQFVNREFARMIKSRYPEVLFINREEDMGIDNLRKAKHSYYPDRMEVKHIARFGVRGQA